MRISLIPLCFGVGLFACGPSTPKVESDEGFYPDTGSDDGGDGGDGTDGTDGTDTGEEEPEVIIDRDVEYDCSAMPDFNAGDRIMGEPRGYHGIAFDDFGNQIGWDGRRAITRSVYDGEREAWVAGVGGMEQIDRLPDGTWAFANPAAGAIVRLTEDGATEVISTAVSWAYGVRTGPDGKLYVADGSVYRIDPDTGEAEMLVPAPPSGEWVAHSLDFSLDSTVLYIGTIGSGQLLSVPLDDTLTPTEEPSVFASVGYGWHDAVVLDACGYIYVPDYFSSGFYRISPDGSEVIPIADASDVYYGHGAVFGSGINGWRYDAVYMPNPYNGNTVREVILGVPPGSSVRTYLGVPVGFGG